jgi:hypothetical protein
MESHNYRCLYSLRAKCLNAYPDTIPPVWLDNLPVNIMDSGNSAIPLYVAGVATGTKATVGALCSGAPNSSTRAYSVYAPGEQYVMGTNLGDCTLTVLGAIFSNMKVQEAISGIVLYNWPP